MGNYVRVAVTPLVHRLQPVQIVNRIGIRRRILSSEWWIADDRVEPRALAVEYVGKLDVPVKRDKWGARVPRFFKRLAIAIGFASTDSMQELEPLRLTVGSRVRREERGDDQVPEQPHFVQLCLRLVPYVPQSPVGDILAGLHNFSA